VKTKCEKIQVYASNGVNCGELIMHKKPDEWQWYCACGMHNYSAEALREIADLLDNAKNNKLVFDKDKT
jgi:hypothetical protein